MSNATLEKLLNEHIQGAISFTNYRKKRQQYINAFVNGESTDISMPRNEDTKRFESAPVEATNTVELVIPTLDKSESLPSNNIVKLASVAVLLVIAGLAWFYSSDSSNSIQESKPKKVASPAPVEIVADEPFIVEFISANHWDSESLSDFVVKWQKLTRDQQLQARKSKVFIKLNAELQQRILEIRALKAAKNRRAEKQENLLIWFATELSIPVS